MPWAPNCVVTARLTFSPDDPEIQRRVSRSAVLITRPEPGATDTAARLCRMGFRPVLAPALTIRPGRTLTLGNAQAILVTSANAVPSLPQTACPLLAVGDATAAAARAAGFADVRSADGDAVDLADLAKATLDRRAGPVLLASGAGQGQPLAAVLRAQGFRVHRRIAYAARPLRSLPSPARQALAAGQIAWALFFSADTARAFRAALTRTHLDQAVSGIGALTIGQPAAEALAGLPWRLIRVAAAPTQDAMLDMLPR